MGLFTRLAETIVGSSVNAGWLRTWMTEVERMTEAALLAGRIYDALTDLEADLAHPANTSALVIGDNAANDGLYRKSGGAGTGEWMRVGDVPGYAFVVATDDGGPANAIAATTALPVSGSQLITVPIVLTNTTDGPTVSFNGGSDLAIETFAGNPVVAGGLPAGSEMTGRISGSKFKLLSDQATAAIVAGVEADRIAAQQARDEAVAAAAAALGSDLIVKDHTELAALTADNVDMGNVVWLKELGGAVKRVASDPDLYYGLTGGLQYQVLPLDGKFNVMMFGTKGDFVHNDGPAFQQSIIAARRNRVQKIIVPQNVAGAAYVIDGQTLHEGPGFSRLIWEGAGLAATTIWWRNMAFGQFAYNLDKAPEDVSYGHGFRDLTLRCENNFTASGIRVRNASYFYLENMQIFSFFDGVVFTGETFDITGATQANPVVITAPGHGFADGDKAIIDGVGGMTQLNDRKFTVANVTTDTFELVGENGTSHGAFTSGGFASEEQSTFSNGGRNVIFNAIRRNSVRFERFRGGGHYLFDNWTLQSETAEGIYGDPWSDVGQITQIAPNYEQCQVNDFRWDGTLRGLEVSGNRTEGLNGTAHFLLNPGPGKFISGVSLTGGFYTADAGAAVPLVINGNGGDVLGFHFAGNHVSYGGVGTYFVTLNGAGASGVIEANHGNQVMAGAVNTSRAGVRVQNNSDANGALPEFKGVTDEGGSWTPTDQSGAGLTLSNVDAKYKVVDDWVYYNGTVTYPSTVDTSRATLSLPVNTDGSAASRAGGIVTYANVPAQSFQGFPGAAQLRILHQLDGQDITNADLSGRTIYFSGHYQRA